MLTSTLLARLDLKNATEQELLSTNGLLPRRADEIEMALHASEVERLIRASLRKGLQARRASVIFASKQSGLRPLSLWKLQDRVLYRALVDLISLSLPPHLRKRDTFESFARKPLSKKETSYISTTDVSSFYVFVDHDVLCTELINQTGDYEAVAALSRLLEQVMGRRVGLPQVHDSSDVLGDTYIDPVRRLLIRAGHDAFTFSDDFRIGSNSLGQARSALELCAASALDLGLVLNESKTFTFNLQKYENSLSSHSEAETRILRDEQLTDAADSVLRRRNRYDETDENQEPFRPILLLHDLEKVESAIERPENASSLNAATADRVWSIWSDIGSINHNAPIIRSLLAHALPALGLSGHSGPLKSLDQLMSRTPDLAPVVARFLTEYARANSSAEDEVREQISEVTSRDRLNDWQKLWLAHVLGGLSQTEPAPSCLEWLENCVERESAPVSAHAALALGRLQRGTSSLLAGAVDSVGEEWTSSMIWALGRIDPLLASSVADSELDRLLVPEAP